MTAELPAIIIEFDSNSFFIRNPIFYKILHCKIYKILVKINKIMALLYFIPHPATLEQGEIYSVKLRVF
jgi:hypothetical protein